MQYYNLEDVAAPQLNVANVNYISCMKAESVLIMEHDTAAFDPPHGLTMPLEMQSVSGCLLNDPC